MNVLAPVLLFASPSFYPIENLGSMQRVLAAVNPVTYGVTALREALLNGLGNAWPYFLLLAVVGAGAVLGVSRALVRQSRTL